MAFIFNALSGQFDAVPPGQTLRFPGILSIASGKTFTVSNTLTLVGTDSTTMTFPATSATVARTDAGNTFIGLSTGTGWNLTTPTITTSLVFGNGQGFLDVAANTTGLSNGTNAQKFQIYETRDAGLSNYSRLSISAPSGGPITFASEAAGTGTARQFQFTTQNTGALTVAASASATSGGTVSFSATNTSSTGISALSAVNDTGTGGVQFQVWGHSTAGTLLGLPLATLGDMYVYGAFTLRTGAASSPIVLAPNGVERFRISDSFIQMGADINGTAPAQIFQAADAITGSNLAGGNLTLRPGAGMGTGTVSALIVQTPTIAASGANTQVQATRLTIDSAGVKCSAPIWVDNAAVTGLVAGAVAALTTATIVIYDSTGQAYRVPCVI